MAEERLYVKFVLPKQGKEKKKPGGGGKTMPFSAVTPTTRARLTTGLEAAERLLVNLPLSRPVIPLKAVLTAKALAKSHWRDELFDQKSCPIIGAGKPGEIFLRGSRDGIHVLKNRILNGEREQLVKEISALKELRPIHPDDRLNGISTSPSCFFSCYRDGGSPNNQGKSFLTTRIQIHKQPEVAQC